MVLDYLILLPISRWLFIDIFSLHNCFFFLIKIGRLLIFNWSEKTDIN